MVIEAARANNLLNVGGQLQLRTPHVSCECYWVEVDTFKTVPDNLPWLKRVAKSAAVALSQFQALRDRYDFVRELRDGFPEQLNAFENVGGDLSSAVRFVWYVESEIEALNHVHN